VAQWDGVVDRDKLLLFLWIDQLHQVHTEGGAFEAPNDAELDVPGGVTGSLDSAVTHQVHTSTALTAA
jgi:hypothetical protein